MPMATALPMLVFLAVGGSPWDRANEILEGRVSGRQIPIIPPPCNLLPSTLV